MFKYRGMRWLILQPTKFRTWHDLLESYQTMSHSRPRKWINGLLQ